jgi:hypothetical protein
LFIFVHGKNDDKHTSIASVAYSLAILGDWIASETADTAKVSAKSSFSSYVFERAEKLLWRTKLLQVL